MLNTLIKTDANNFDSRRDPILLETGGSIKPNVPPTLDNNTIPGTVENVTNFLSSNSEMILILVLFYFAVKK